MLADSIEGGMTNTTSSTSTMVDAAAAATAAAANDCDTAGRKRKLEDMAPSYDYTHTIQSCKQEGGESAAT